MKMKHAVVIIAALVELVGVIIAAIIGAAWGKSNVTVIVQLDGKNIVLNDEDIQKMASENEALLNQISNYEKQITNLENESKDLAVKLGVANEELNEIPAIEFQNCGLSINGDEININKDKSYVAINGRQYYSKEFVDNLLPDNMSVTIKDEMLYIGKIVKEKTNLIDVPVITSDSCLKYDSVVDTYGNIHTNAVYFASSGNITFNAGRQYSNFKCTIAMKKESNGKGYLQIETDDGNIAYLSPEITNTTEPFEIDIPINQTSNFTIKCMKSGYSNCNILLLNTVLYNQE